MPSNSLAGAMRNAARVESALLDDWRLQIKPASREYLVAAGSQEALGDGSPWRRMDALPALGHLLSANCSVTLDFYACADSMRKAYFAGCCHRTFSSWPAARRVQYVDRRLRPLLHFRCARWPCEAGIRNRIDALQRKGFGMAMALPCRRGEEVSAFLRRRALAAREHIQRLGLWSADHAKLVLKWDAHLRRERNSESPAARVLQWHDGAWLQEQRVAAGSARATAGRLRRRVVRHVFPRWEEGVEHARGT